MNTKPMPHDVMEVVDAMRASASGTGPTNYMLVHHWTLKTRKAV